MSSISTHVLDAVLGKPAAGIAVRLDRLNELAGLPGLPGLPGLVGLIGRHQREQSPSSLIGEAATDTDGRCRDLWSQCPKGCYRLIFSTHSYFQANNRTSVYPEITITFEVDGDSHYHIPLLLSDNSYTTYRGS